MERFEYLEPRELGEAVELLARHPGEARVVAGGQSLIVMLRQRLLSPRYLIGLDRIPGLGEVRQGDGHLSIGALATHREVATHPLVQGEAGVLAQAVARVGSPPVRVLGTLGGNLCHNEVGADPPPALLALDARARIAGPSGERELPLHQFFTGYFETALHEDEILTHILVPRLPPGAKGVYVKYSHRVVDRAIVGVAVVGQFQGPVCQEVRVALGGVAPVPFRARQTEELLTGKPLTEELLEQAGEVASGESRPLSDAHASADYRRQMVKVFLKRALRQLTSP